MTRICVYCGSSPGALPEYAAMAAAFGTACARRGLTVVYGGGGAGLMGVLADAALAAGGDVIGVIPRAMVEQGWAHRGLSGLEEVGSMHERKHRMAELADAFVALPGGIGTLEEIVEIFTWLQLGLHAKPVGLLNAAGFYDPLLKFFAHMRDHRFLSAAHHDLLMVGGETEGLLDSLAAHTGLLNPKTDFEPRRARRHEGK